MNQRNLFAELKRRNVYKGRPLYLVGGGCFLGARAGFSGFDYLSAIGLIVW